MYPQVFEIRLDDESSKKFHAGQVIEGRLILVLKKEKAVRGILIRLIGKGNVYWDTGINHNNVFSESEMYVNAVCHLLSTEDGRQTVLSPGSYEYFFSLQLPHNIPSSIEGQHCFVRYYLEAAIQRPWKDDQIQESVIHVTSISDLNNRPETTEPASIQKEKTVGFNICQTGPMVLNFMLGKTGFVPGEYLQFGAEVRNTSNTKINRVQVSLKRQLTSHAKGESKSTFDKILQLNGPSVEVGGYLVWQSNFEIPLLTPSELLGCNIISLQYYIEIKLALEKWADIKYNMPIVIGTSPYCIKDQRKSSDALLYHETPIKAPKSRKNSLALSRKSSVVKSPITGEEFHYDNVPWGSGEEDGHSPAVTSPPVKTTATENGFSFSSLPPLDLIFFQHKLERSPYFKCYEDCHCEFNYANRVNPNIAQETTRPPRPHSNPGHFWERSTYWNEENE